MITATNETSGGMSYANWPTGELPPHFPDISKLDEDPNQEVVGRTLHLEVPRDQLILTVSQAEYYGLETNQAILYYFARAQDKYSGAAVIHDNALNPAQYMHPHADKTANTYDEEKASKIKIRSFEPRTPQEIGTASAAYAEACLLYGITHWQPGTLQLSPIFFGQAHENLAQAGDYEGVAYNARRAAEAAALLGDHGGFKGWMKFADLPAGAPSAVWRAYKPARDSWKAYKERESKMGGMSDEAMRLYSLTLGIAALAHVHHYANTCNDIPPELLPEEDGRLVVDYNNYGKLITYLQDRHETTKKVDDEGEPYVIASVTLSDAERDNVAAIGESDTTAPAGQAVAA